MEDERELITNNQFAITNTKYVKWKMERILHNDQFTINNTEYVKWKMDDGKDITQ
jgi:hypothetical protein